MIWNEPNNKSHWDPEIDPDWSRFGELVRLAGAAIASERSDVARVLGGLSPIDPAFLRRLDALGALGAVDVIGIHGFPLDWNLWSIDEWPGKIAEISAVTEKPVWVTEVGASSFGAEEVQEWALTRTRELLAGAAPRIHWYSLLDLPKTWEATTRHREAEGASYYRHFHMGLIDERGQRKRAYARFAEAAGAFGLCQWFHFEDPRLDFACDAMRALGVRALRTGLSWADFERPGGPEWIDRLMTALDPFELTLTFCFTPEHRGIAPHHTSAPREPEAFADFCAAMLGRYS